MQTDNVFHTRFKDVVWYSQTDNTNVTVGGAGGIGSWFCFLAARANFNILVYDFDIIQESNLGGQLFSRTDIEGFKVSAMAEFIGNYADKSISTFISNINEGFIVNPVMVSCFDNMAARKTFFKKWKEVYGEYPGAIFIDGRLEVESMQIYCIRGGDTASIKEYEDVHLFDDTKIPDASCTLKQTSHAAAMIASHMVGMLTNHISNIVERAEVRDVPKRWEYFIPANYTETLSGSEWNLTN